jgi:6-phosphogluconolactonase
VRNLLSALLVLAAAGHAANYLVLTGAYTGGPVKGIFGYRFRTNNGKLTASGVAVDTPDPTFLVEHPSHRFVYAVNRKEGTVSAFAVDFKHDRLVPLNRVSSRGEAPCHLAFDRTGRWLAVANYDSGSMAILPVGADGKLGEAVAVDRHEGSSIHPRQKSAHASGVAFSMDNRFLFLADLGLDKLFVYHFDVSHGAIAPNDPAFVAEAPGAGPGRVGVHISGQVIYVLNELNSTISAYFYDAPSGTLKPFQTLTTLPATFVGSNTASSLAISAGGTLLYVSNVGSDTIALFSIDVDRLSLTPIDHTPTLGQSPYEFAIDPTGQFLLAANQNSSTVEIFRMQHMTGQLRPVGHPDTAPAPTDVLMIPVPVPGR